MRFNQAEWDLVCYMGLDRASRALRYRNHRESGESDYSIHRNGYAAELAFCIDHDRMPDLGRRAHNDCDVCDVDVKYSRGHYMSIHRSTADKNIGRFACYAGDPRDLTYMGWILRDDALVPEYERRGRSGHPYWSIPLHALNGGLCESTLQR